MRWLYAHLCSKTTRAKGIASTLAHYALEWAKKHQKAVIVYCPFVAAYLKRHTEYSSIIDKNYR